MSSFAISQTTTTVADTLYGPSGQALTGSITITNNVTFTSAGGTVVPQGVIATVPINNGAFTVNLVPNAGSTPPYSSYAVSYHIGATYIAQTWQVPQSASPVGLAAVVVPPLIISGVTSVGLQMPGIFGVGGSPISGAGTINVTLNSEAQSTVFAAPSSGTGLPSFRVLVPADIPAVNLSGAGNGGTYNVLPVASGGTGLTAVGLSGQCLGTNGSVMQWQACGGGGSVTSVGLTLPNIFSVTGTPVTTSGTLTGTLANENANLVFAGPSSGTAAAPTFRALVSADIPALNYQGPLTTYAAPANEFLTGFTSPNTFAAAQPSFANLSGTLAANQCPDPGASSLGCTESAAAVSHEWINSISTAGVPALSQPAFTDISGSVASSQLPNPSATALGGVQSAAAVSHEWISSISTAGVPALSQPAFTDISGAATLGQLPATLAQFTGTITAGDCAKWSSSGVVTDAGHICPSPDQFKEEAASYTVLPTDTGTYFVMNCASACTLTLPAASQGAAWSIAGENIGAGPVTVAPNGLDYNGQTASVVFTQGEGFFLSSDGTNYFGTIPMVAGANVTFTPSTTSLSIAASGSGGMAIGGAVSGGTSQSVLFINSSNQLAQDETNFNWNDSAKTLTVGNIVLNGGSTSQTLTLPTAAMSPGPGSAVSFGSNTGNVPSISANGGAVTPVAPLNGDLGGSWTGAEVVGLHFGANSVPLGSTAPVTGQLLGWGGTTTSWYPNGGVGSVANNTSSVNNIAQTFSASGNGTTVTLTVTGSPNYQPFLVNDTVNVADCASSGPPEGNYTVTAETTTTIQYASTYNGTTTGCFATLTSQASSASNVVTVRIYPQPFAANQTIQVTGCSATSFDIFPVSVTSVTSDTVTFTVAGTSGTSTACNLAGGTTNGDLMAITPGGATFPASGNTGPVYVVASGGGVTGNALYATGGNVACTMDSTASNTAGEYVIESASIPVDCSATASPGSAFVLGTMVSNSTTAGSTATISIQGGYSGGSGGLSGLTTNAVMKATSATSAGNSAMSDNGTDVTSTEPIGIPSGTAALPALYFTSSANTGLYLSSAVSAMILDYAGSAAAGVFSGGISMGGANRVTFGRSFSEFDAGLSADTNISPTQAIVDLGNGTSHNTAGNLIGSGVGVAMGNDATTGTTANTLTKLTGASSNVVIAATTDTSGVIGITIAGAGKTGNADVITSGAVSCVFDGATTAGDYVSISSTTGGDCHDAGAARPASGEIIGRVLSTNAAAGAYQILEELENE